MTTLIIRDAIHGSIELNALEEKIIDSPLLQRLRFVKQLSAAYLVFPSAQHTRFEHSVGAMHLSGTLCKRLQVDPVQAQLVRLAALLHDIGHSAFAHEAERVLVTHAKMNHEQRGIVLLKESDLSSVIEREGLSVKEIEAMLQGKGLGSLLTKDMGTDRIDYLMRDAYFTGVAYSLIDADRLMQSMTVHDGEVMVTEKGRLAAESLLASRYFMFNVVYFHPTVRIAGEMTVRAVERAIEDRAIDAESVFSGTDYGVLSALAEKYVLAQRVLERRLFKKALVIDTSVDEHASRFFSSAHAGTQLHAAMEEAGFVEDEYAVCLPSSHTKKLSVKLLSSEKKIEDLAHTSHLVQALQKERREKHFILACDESKKEKAANAVKRLIGS